MAFLDRVDEVLGHPGERAPLTEAVVLANARHVAFFEETLRKCARLRKKYLEVGNYSKTWFARESFKLLSVSSLWEYRNGQTSANQSFENLDEAFAALNLTPEWLAMVSSNLTLMLESELSFEDPGSVPEAVCLPYPSLDCFWCHGDPERSMPSDLFWSPQEARALDGPVEDWQRRAQSCHY